MIRLVAQRLLAMVPVLLLVTVGVFLLLALIPGDPAVTLAGGSSATPAAIEEVRRTLHLDQPLHIQFWYWISGVVQLDFGESMLSGQPVLGEIAARLPVTLGLTLAATVVTLLIAIPLGLISGLYPDGITDSLVRTLTSAGLAIPNFWLAVMLVSFLAVQAGLFPPTGYVAPTDSFTGWVQAVTLPAVALGLSAAASVARQLRRALIEVMDSNYVRTAWAKGASTRTVVIGHALKNAAIPAVTVLGIHIGYLLGGAVIIEQIFAIPGLGSYMVVGITGQDMPVVQGVLLIFALFQMLMSLLIDISYGYLNPKVRVA